MFSCEMNVRDLTLVRTGSNRPFPNENFVKMTLKAYSLVSNTLREEIFAGRNFRGRNFSGI